MTSIYRQRLLDYAASFKDKPDCSKDVLGSETTVGDILQVQLQHHMDQVETEEGTIEREEPDKSKADESAASLTPKTKVGGNVGAAVRAARLHVSARSHRTSVSATTTTSGSSGEYEKLRPKRSFTPGQSKFSTMMEAKSEGSCWRRKEKEEVKGQACSPFTVCLPHQFKTLSK